MSLDIRHDENGSRFVATIDAHDAYVAYMPVDDQTLEYRRTYVPTELRGQGIAGKLVAWALEYARAHGYRVIPTCSYVRGYLERNPEYQDLAAS
jgi:predicted GNAT family acetyltransferase